MMKKLTSYFLIFMLAFPPVMFYKPTRTEAYIVPLARAAFIVAQRAGLIKSVGSSLSIALKPVGGKLYRAVFKDWTALKTAAAGSALAHALAIFGDYGFTDKPIASCVNAVNPLTGANGGKPSDIVQYYSAYTTGSINSVSSFTARLTSFSLSSDQSQIFWKGDYWDVATGTVKQAVYPPEPCLTELAGVSALKQYQDDKIIPIQTDFIALEAESSTFFDSAQNVVSQQTSGLETAPLNAEGFSLEEVQTLDFTDMNGVQHTYSTNADGSISKDNLPMPDSMSITDANGIEHEYTIDPVTHTMLDNGGDVGNYATWTDRDGQTHIVTEDPSTGQLQDNGYAWNPNYTASNPSGGSSSSTPVSSGSFSSTATSTNTAVTTDAAGTVISTTVTTTNTTSTGTNDVDFTPAINALGRVVTESKKTTDAVNNLNDTLVANRNDDIASETSQLDTIRAAESGKSYMGVTAFMSRVKSSPFYSSLNSGLTFNGSSGYPSWSATPHIPIFSHDFTFTIGLDTADYAGFFVAIKSVFLVVASFFAFRRVFG